MTGSLASLFAAAVLFVGSHLVLSSAPVRRAVINSLGDRAFRGFYAAVAVVLLGWFITAYGAAPFTPVWDPPTALRHLSLTVMPIACILLVAGLSKSNPTIVGVDSGRIVAAGPQGITKLTRHPVMWSFALWGVSHFLANGDAASMVLFASLTFLALVGAWHIDQRKRRELGPAWDAYAADTSFVPFAAVIAGRTQLRFADVGWRAVLGGVVLFGLLLWVHPWLFGVNPLAGG